MFLSALLIGFMGSMHCVLMCSPITLMLGGKNSTSQFVLQRLYYNTGRLFGYGVLGILAGLFGKLINLSGLQQWFSIGFGILLLLTLLIYDSNTLFNPTFKPLQKIVGFLRSKFTIVHQSQWKLKGLTIGFLNGFLPCGLVYMALIGAATMDSITDAVLYMIIFGLGTWPMMLLVSFFGGLFNKVNSVKLLKVIPFIVALLFIVRGLGLGIPYLSPKIEINRTGNYSVECVEEPK